jgi:hypothetical protein
LSERFAALPKCRKAIMIKDFAELTRTRIFP